MTYLLGADRTDSERRANWAALRNFEELPEGVIEILILPGESTIINQSRIIQGKGSDKTVIDVYPKTLTGNFFRMFDCSSLRSGNVIFRDMTILGPSGIPNNLNDKTSCIYWVTGNDFNSKLTVENVCISGLFESGIQRSGGGELNVINCIINAYEAPVKFYESTWTPNSGRLLEVGNYFSGFGSKTTSIGLYIHPHLDCTIVQSTFEKFDRYGIYQHSSNEFGGNHITRLIDCTFIDCDVVQTAKSGSFEMIGGKHTCDTVGPGSIIRNDAKFIGVEIDSRRQYNMGAGSPLRAAFYNCLFKPRAIFMSASGAAGSEVLFRDCKWELRENGRPLNITSIFEGKVLVWGGELVDNNTINPPWMFNLQGNTEALFKDFKIKTNRAKWHTDGPNATVTTDNVEVTA